MFSRLEAREILRHLDTADCDSDVVAKLAEIANQANVPHLPQRMIVPADADRKVAAEVLAAPFQPTDVLEMNRGDYGHLSDDEFVGLKSRRLQEAKMAAEKAKTLGYEVLAPTRLPPGYGTEKNVAIGESNSVGDKCVSINGDGFSVFACKNGHGYVQNNPAVHGCTTCALEGNSSANREEAQIAQTQRIDKGAIAGEDSRW